MTEPGDEPVDEQHVEKTLDELSAELAAARAALRDGIMREDLFTPPEREQMLRSLSALDTFAEEITSVARRRVMALEREKARAERTNRTNKVVKTGAGRRLARARRPARRAARRSMVGVRLLVPYVQGGLRPETIMALNTCGIDGDAYMMTRDDSYHELLQGEWNQGNELVVVEQDIVPHATALDELLQCHSAWCAFGDSTRPSGCTRVWAARSFRRGCRDVPGCAEDDRQLVRRQACSEALVPAGRLAEVVSHRTRGRAARAWDSPAPARRRAHGCVTEEDLAAVRAKAQGGSDSSTNGEAAKTEPNYSDDIPSAPTFTFLIPTHREDRPLQRCLDSLAPQLLPGDEVYVIGDTCNGPLPKVRSLVESYRNSDSTPGPVPVSAPQRQPPYMGA